MTRDSSATVLLEALNRLGLRSGRIDLPAVWPTLATWWSTPVSDLAGGQQDRLDFLLSLTPDTPYREPVFAGEPPAAVGTGELVCIEFGREFEQRTGPISHSGIGGGARVVFWYAYDARWQRLRERSDWIEMGYRTPQVDVSNFSWSTARLIEFIEQESGVLEAAARGSALALVVVAEGDEVICVTSRSAGTGTRQ